MTAPRNIRTSGNRTPEHTPRPDCTYGPGGAPCWQCIHLHPGPRRIYPGRNVNLNPMAKPKPSLTQRIWQGMYVAVTVAVAVVAFILIVAAATRQS